MKRSWLWAVLPLTILGILIAVFLRLNPLQVLVGSAPPVESIQIERAVLKSDEPIRLLIRGNGTDPVQIAQVQVDGAYWQFQQDPPGEISRLKSVQIEIPYPWMEGETHHIKVLTATGLTFDYSIDVALPTPDADPARLLHYGGLGIFVGVVPVGLGMLFFPYLKTLGNQGIQFILTLTLGLLAFLLVDSLQEGVKLATEAASVFQGGSLVWLSAATAFLTLLMISRRGGNVPEGMALATYLALGIGLHNLGEGLAIGSAFAVGEAGLGSLLVVGFTLHNLTEGIGIAAPLIRLQPRLWVFVSLAALAGLPAVLGSWLGAFAYSPQWAALFLGIGSGAILQVMVEVGSYVRRLNEPRGSWLTIPGLAGFSLGLGIMYATALLV
ncbi:MAG: metal transporter [Cyanobacteriota bacterium]|nr:metal transporter [Cyanobacteriota bacterium]